MPDGVTLNAAEYARQQIEGADRIDDFERIPQDSETLAALLDARFPERLPTPSEADRDYLIYLGKRDMVNYLKMWIKQSKEDESHVHG